LIVEDLRVRFYTYEGIVKAIDDVSLYLRDGETLGLVGETGCGKTVTVLSSMVLTPPPGKIIAGRVLLRTEDGKLINLLDLDERTLRSIRGKYMSIIFQEPGAALNPVYTVGDQIVEALILHRRDYYVRKVIDELRSLLRSDGNILKRLWWKYELYIYNKLVRDEGSRLIKLISITPFLKRYRNKMVEIAWRDAVELLRDMEIADPERVAKMYPHELSGGMRQRAVIAMALASNPSILIADEPTTSLDVTVQAQILELMRKLKKEYGSSIIFITHDLGVAAEMCNRIAVMYAGNMVEIADTEKLFDKPLHPYTKGLLDSIPKAGKSLKGIPGTVPDLINPPSGCRFHPRCPHRFEPCDKVKPELKEVEKDHYVACHLYSLR
jgi:peptide/nickel transport system ATP-binding protein